ncbi:MAG TPA: hypothetical protein VFQ66_04405 [Candidatus Limnocylindria bacterium]|nr:hypothetical protein [Candidatus Limnocylindria bacterium]
MLDLSFLVGLALGTIVTGFCAIGSFNRGFDSVRRTSWSREHAARQRAVVSSRAAARAVSHRNAEGALSKAS